MRLHFHRWLKLETRQYAANRYGFIIGCTMCDKTKEIEWNDFL